MQGHESTNLIPRFIAQEFQANQTRGRFAAATLFMDIRGFTPLTESLIAYGKQGLESLPKVMNTLYTPVVDTIYAYGGFIASFCGDALTALFPQPVEPMRACQAAWHVTSMFEQTGSQDTRAGRFTLSVRIGLAYGEIHWGILPGGGKKTFYFAGNALKHSQEAQKHAQDAVVMHRSLAPFVPPGQALFAGNDFTGIPLHESPALPDCPHAGPVAATITHAFVADAVFKSPQSGEFRQVAGLFIGMADPGSMEKLEAVLKTVAGQVDRFAGSLFPMDLQPDRVIFPIVMGAPVAHDDDCQRALFCLSALRRGIDIPFQAGLAFGTVFSGFVGCKKRKQFTCLGDTMNVAARLMQAAPAHETYMTQTAARMVKPKFRAAFLKQTALKGKGQNTAVYHLSHPYETGYTNPFSGPLIGRTREMQRLREEIDTQLSAEEMGGTIYITGTAGVGKSRLAYQVLDVYKDRTAPFILQGDRFSTAGFHAFAVMLQDYLHINGHTDRSARNRACDLALAGVFRFPGKGGGKDVAAGKLRHTTFLLRCLMGLEPAGLTGISASAYREIFGQALLAFFNAARRERPLLLILEDLQWLDSDSRYALELFAKVGIPLVIVATVRTDDPDQHARLTFPPEWTCLTLNLRQWDKDDVRRYLGARLSAPVSSGLLQHVAKRTEGIPLYIEQYTRYLQDKKLVMRNRHGYQLRQGTPPDLPAGLANLLVSRIDHLPVAVKETVQIASVLGHEFSRELLVRHLGFAAHSMHDCHIEKNRIPICIAQASEENIWHMAAGSRCRFHHDLLREAAYNMQSAGRLRRLHGLAAVCLEKQPVHDRAYAGMVFHFSRAEQDKKALKYAIIGGAAAGEKSAFQQAVLLYQKALALAGKVHGKDSSQRAYILAALGWNYRQMNQFINAQEALLEAREIYARMPAAYAVKLVAVYLELSSLHRELGQMEKAHAANENAFGLCRAYLGEAHADAAACFVNRALLSAIKGNYEQAYTHANRSLAMRLKLFGARHKAVAQSYSVLGDICFSMKRLDEADAFYQKALALLQDLYSSFHLDVAQALVSLAVLRTKQNDPAVASLCEKSLDITRHFLGEHNLRTAACYDALGNYYYYKRQIDKALIYCQKALNIRLELLAEEHLDTAASYDSLAFIYYYMGHFAKAETLFQRVAEIKGKLLGKDHPAMCRCYESLIRICWVQQKYAQALRWFDYMARETTILRKQSKRTKANLHWIIGKILGRRGDKREAHHFRRAAALLFQINEIAGAYGSAARVRKSEQKGLPNGAGPSQPESTDRLEAGAEDFISPEQTSDTAPALGTVCFASRTGSFRVRHGRNSYACPCLVDDFPAGRHAIFIAAGDRWYQDVLQVTPDEATNYLWSEERQSRLHHAVDKNGVAMPSMACWKNRDGVWEREVTIKGVDLSLVYIHPGEFDMGFANGRGEECERPRHHVRISRGFWLGKYVVTQQQWRTWMGTTPWRGETYLRGSAFASRAPRVTWEECDELLSATLWRGKAYTRGRCPDCPATHISWFDCEKLITMLNTQGLGVFRFPTEAEWEYACRAGTRTRYFWGNSPEGISEFAWYDERLAYEEDQYAHRVGQKRPNPWGLYDMVGNVFEWCNDWYADDYYSLSPVDDPGGPATGAKRVVRGATRTCSGWGCRSAVRESFLPQNYFLNLGVRLVCEAG